MRPFVPEKLPMTHINWVSLMPAIGRANRSVAEYNGVLYGVPNPEVLLAPLTTQEAVLSSKIEGTRATLGEVLEFEAGNAPEEQSRRLDIHEILNYRRALQAAEKSLKTKPFNLNLLRRLHEHLLQGVRGANKRRGEFRQEQNWIGIEKTPIEQADFVPPEPHLLPDYLDNWEKYYHSDQPDSLVQLAVVHAQFEIIHPFLDGNGRLGRILIPLFLTEKQLLNRPMFYLSAYLEEHREEYIARLRSLGREDGCWNRWIEFFLRAISEQAMLNVRKARQIMDLYERLKGQIRELTHSQFAGPLLDILFENPIVRSAHFEGLPNMPSRPMISLLLGKLKKAGILKTLREGRGRRAQILAFPELLNLCEGRKAF
jgi:Fic family protein